MVDFLIIYNVRIAYERRIDLGRVGSPYQAKDTGCVEKMYTLHQVQERGVEVTFLLYHPNHLGMWVSGN